MRYGAELAAGGLKIRESRVVAALLLDRLNGAGFTPIHGCLAATVKRSLLLQLCHGRRAQRNHSRDGYA